jgi:hypothetical protein
METSVDWLEAKYKEAFQEELRGLKRRREACSNCTIEDLEGTLRHLYRMDGDGWLGRGQVQDISLAAAIAAYELFISEWKAENLSSS